MNSDFVSWRGHRVHVKDTGTGDPLLLVTGVGGNTDMWTPFAGELTTRRIISFDAPGTGQSSTPMFPVTIQALAELVVAVLDHRQVPWADVVGFSYGGTIAQQLAHDHPSRVRRLVLAATHCGIGAVPGTIGAVTGITTPMRFYSQSYFHRTAGACYGGVTARSASTRRRMMETRRRYPPSAYGYAMQLLGIAGWSSWSFLPAITHETLVISGDDDPLVPMANAEMIAGRIPRARLEIVKRGGHLLLWDDAANLAKRIGRFIDGAIDVDPADDVNDADETDVMSGDSVVGSLPLN
jgi:pimeloyl-ACP methyl ester carboxylesterase